MSGLLRGAAQSPKPEAPQSTKLFKSTGRSPVKQLLNGLFRLFLITKTFTGKLLWFSSCVALMYLVPTQILLFKDQEAILQRMGDKMM